MLNIPIVSYSCVVNSISLITVGHGWLLNYHFIYDVTALMTIIIILISFALPKSSEKERVPDPVKPPVATTITQ